MPSRVESQLRLLDWSSGPRALWRHRMDGGSVAIWTPVGIDPGDYYITVWARSTPGAQSATATVELTVLAPPACTAATISASTANAATSSEPVDLAVTSALWWPSQLRILGESPGEHRR